MKNPDLPVNITPTHAVATMADASYFRQKDIGFGIHCARVRPKICDTSGNATRKRQRTAICVDGAGRN